MTLAPRSLKCLEGVHPDIAAVVRRADELGARFHITCGLRTVEEQTRLVKAGKSKTMKSRHLTGHAVDFVVAEPGGGVSYDHEDMAACAAIFKRAALEMGIAIEWGGDWKSFVDTPHIELDRKVYKADGKIEAPQKEIEAGGASISVPVAEGVSPAAPLPRSGTIWGSLTGLAGGVGMMFHESAGAGMEIAVDVIKVIADLSPLRDALVNAGASTKSVFFGLVTFGTAYAASRRIKASQEGKPG